MKSKTATFLHQLLHQYKNGNTREADKFDIQCIRRSISEEPLRTMTMISNIMSGEKEYCNFICGCNAFSMSSSLPFSNVNGKHNGSFEFQPVDPHLNGQINVCKSDKRPPNRNHNKNNQIHSTYSSKCVRAWVKVMTDQVIMFFWTGEGELYELPSGKC